MYLHFVYKRTFYIEIGFFLLKNLDSTTFEAKMSYYTKYDIWII